MGSVSTADWNEEVSLAKQTSSETGEDYRVILSQWVNEDGWDFISNSSNNFGNITYYGGAGQTGYFKASNGQKFATYATPQAGAQAYANLINSNYQSVAQGKTPAAQISALQASPWDAGHYSGLPAVYNSVVTKLGDKSAKLQTTGTPSSSGAGSTPSGPTIAGIDSNKIITWVLIGGAVL